MSHEQDLRPTILNTLMTTPHRELGALYPVHTEIAAADPIFYAHLAAWYAVKGTVRDHNEVFATVLALSKFPGHREVGLALLRRLPPYQVARIIDYIKGREVTKQVLRPGAEKLKREKGKPAPTKAQQEAAYMKVTEKVGLFRVVPTSLRTEVLRFLKEREGDTAWFDSCVLTARSSMKHLYATLRLAPGPRAQAILFKGEPPDDSSAAIVKALGQASTPEEQARAIVAHRIPYRVAVGVVSEVTPMVLAALVNSMTPAEILNSMESLQERGVMDNPELRGLVDAKLVQAQTDKRVAPMKAKKTLQTVKHLDVGTEAALAEVTQRQITSRGKITQPTAIFFDKSTSMTKAIEIGKQLAALVSAICTADLFVYAFDTIAYPIKPAKPKDGVITLAGWEKEMRGIYPGGSTSVGVALKRMAKQGERVTQLVIVTDEGENNPPYFATAYREYAAAMNVQPTVTLVRVPGDQGVATKITEACKGLGVELNTLNWDAAKSDYYSLGNVVQFLSQSSMSDLVMEILAYPLPERRAY